MNKFKISKSSKLSFILVFILLGCNEFIRIFDKKFNYLRVVYLISLASGPYLFNESKQLKNIKNIKEDIVYSSLEKGMYLILNNIKYKENV